MPVTPDVYAESRGERSHAEPRRLADLRSELEVLGDLLRQLEEANPQRVAQLVEDLRARLRVIGELGEMVASGLEPLGEP